MRNTAAKSLHRQAEKETVGKSESETKRVYKALKKRHSNGLLRKYN